MDLAGIAQCLPRIFLESSRPENFLRDQLLEERLILDLDRLSFFVWLCLLDLLTCLLRLFYGRYHLLRYICYVKLWEVIESDNKLRTATAESLDIFLNA